MFQVQIPVREKVDSELTSDTSSISNSSWSLGSYTKQFFKGTVALLGFAAVGGITYLASGWFRSKDNGQSPTSKPDSHSGPIVEELDSNGHLVSSNFLAPSQRDHSIAATNVRSATDYMLSNARVEQETFTANGEMSAPKFSSAESAKDHFQLEYREKSIFHEKANGISPFSKEASENFNQGRTKVDKRSATDISLSGNEIVQSGIRLLGSSPSSVNYTYLPSVALSNVGKGWGIKLNGEVAYDHSGWSVNGAGDVNGDGIDDLVIGAPNANPPSRSEAGATYVIFGKTEAWTTPIELSSLSGTTGFKLNGEAASDQSGYSVGRAGDINGDGIDDLVIGAPNADPSGRSNAGATYVVFGKTGVWTMPIELSSLNGTTGFKLNGESAGDWNGWSVSGAGDINGDGIDDLVIGALNADPPSRSEAGATYVIFGKTGTWTTPIELSTLNGTTGFKLNGEATYDQSGYSVSGAGDINGDGIGDLVVGAPYADPFGRSSAGATYVVFGKTGTWTSPIELSSLNGATGFKLYGELGGGVGGDLDGDLSGFSVNGNSDINGDGIKDLIIGAPGADPIHWAGATYVVFGKTGAWTSPIELSSLNGITGFKLNGWSSDATSGGSVRASDFNGDGIDDLIIGASRVTCVVFGKTGAWTTPIDLSSLNGMTGFMLNGESSADGSRGNRAGDINGDGIDDLVIGAPNADPSGRSNAGATYVVFGGYGSRPSLTANHLTIKQGQTVLITDLALNATSFGLDHSSLTFSISSMQRGRFALVSSPTTPITSFTQGQVIGGSVQFVHDNSQIAPSYKVSVNDGLVTTESSNATVTFDAAPILVTNQLNINQGQTVNITSSMISATDAETDPSMLTFTISNLQHGRFELTSSPGTPITSFTQAQITAGSVRFVHDNSQAAPSYKIAVSDGALSTAAASASITFNAAPVLANNQLTINQGQTVTLTSAMLSATDVETDPSMLTFTLSNLQHGRFELVSSPGTPITSFTQAQITAGSVRFVHDNSQIAPSYNIAVSDGTLSTVAASASITFDALPVLVNNQLTVNQGQTVTITGTMINATDIDTNPSTLTFTISDFQHGRFEFTSSPGIPITSFTQAQITAGSVRFVHDNSQIAPSYNIAVSDGTLSTAAASASITFNLAPVLVNNQLTIKQGQTVLLTSSMLSATDVDTDASTLVFTVNNLQHGRFELASNPGIAITSFSQAQVTAGLVKFVHDNSELAPSYQISVSDGKITTNSVSTQINFALQEADASNAARNAIIGGAVSGAVGLIFLALKIYISHKVTQRLKKATRGDQGDVEKQQAEFNQNVVSPVSEAIFAQIQITGCMGNISEANSKSYVAAVVKIILELDKAGVDIHLNQMTPLKQTQLLNEVAHQTKKLLVPKQNCCGNALRFFKSFCVADVSADEMKERAGEIALAVKAALGEEKKGQIELAQVAEEREKKAGAISSSGAILKREDAKIQSQLDGGTLSPKSPEAVSKVEEVVIKVQTPAVIQASPRECWSQSASTSAASKNQEADSKLEKVKDTLSEDKKGEERKEALKPTYIKKEDNKSTVVSSSSVVLDGGSAKVQLPSGSSLPVTLRGGTVFLRTASSGDNAESFEGVPIAKPSMQ